MTRATGVDEAGKGPVLGPMVAAAVTVDPETLPADVDDSKRVRPERRETIAAGLRDRTDVRVSIATVEPHEIDAPDTNMNSLTVRAHARAIAGLARDEEEPLPEGPVIADAGDVSETRFARRVVAAVADGDAASENPNTHDHDDDHAYEPDRAEPLDVTAEHGADASYPVVSAASIVAKVERDRRIEAIADRYTDYGPVGSGYPSDQTTVAFLEAYVDANGSVPECARRSWATCDRLLADAEQAELDGW